MHKHKVIILLSAFILTNAGLIFAQETAVSADIQWLWGEVVSVDANNKQILVKYLDYDMDAEKEMTISADEKTTYENVKVIDDIKPQDTVSIDYMVSAEGKNIAKNISVERIEIEDLPREGLIEEAPQEAPQSQTTP